MNNQCPHMISGIDVQLHPMLPFEKRAWCCNIETKEEGYILTGEKTHGFYWKGTMYLSKEAYDGLKKKMLEVSL